MTLDGVDVKMVFLIRFAAIGGAVPPPSSAPAFTPQPPPQANQSVPTPQPYGGNLQGKCGKIAGRNYVYNCMYASLVWY